ncbi:MAG TPA: HEAT repeat domain-containing protein [Blastocatellia bacterium]|nr:HEAT repeat domain-containing protein [Blastocatellia bacterium]
MKTRQIQLWCLVVFLLAVVVIWLNPARYSSANAEAESPFKKLIGARARLATRESKKYRLPAMSADKVCSLLVSAPSPEEFGANDALQVTLRGGGKTIAGKTLHAGDPDLYVLFRSTGAEEIEISSFASGSIEHAVTVLEWPATSTSTTTVETESNDSWSEANEIKLGQTVWASADDKPYILPLNETIPARGAAPYGRQEDLTGDRLPEGGVDWFKFAYEGDEPKLVHFELDLLERDNIPVDVSVFTVENGEAKSYERGADPVTPPHEVQALAGNKFTTRIITSGTYYVRVDANHAFYQLRTTVYDPPPYNDPRKAVRAGMDYLLSAGDSWHANTPRHGGIVNRVSSAHFETQLCVACHATHFTTRGELTAKQNGYAVNKRWSLQFLTERLANNPLPFYGHKDAYWTRVISAPANVMSRLAALVNQYDGEFTGEKRLSLLNGVAAYLKIYYKGRTELPNDESNGNTPLVSAYEVAWYSWKVFDEMFKLTDENEHREYRDQVRRLIEREKIKNNVDLCYQTMALAEIDPAAYAGRIKRNADRILSLQRDDGQWSMLFEKDSPPVEFQTYHCLYALARAGYPPDHPQIAKSLKFLLERQQDWGGWFDPKQSYENFRTPFRETQFAVMALSEFYKGTDGKGWPAPAMKSLSSSDALLRLRQIDEVWSQPSPQLMRSLIASLNSEEPMVRMASAAALGRAGAKEAVTQLRRLLGDYSKLVQIAAAQALRRIASRSGVQFGVPPSGGRAQSRDLQPEGGTPSINPPEGGTPNFITALDHPNGRARWGATRVFAQHFSYLTGKNEIADKLITRLSDPYAPVRMQAAKSLAQWFYWTKDESLQDRIADAFIARMAVNEHPWMRRNLLEGFYSLADENVRYLYNNWIGHLSQKEDRDKAVEGHRESSRRMAERIARALETGNELQREGLLRGLSEYHLRHGGYTNAGRYTRIGNDIETIVFYPEGAPALERALAPFINSPDASRRRQAILAAYTLRDNALTNLPLAVMRRLNDSDASIRAVSNEFYRSLPLKVVEQNRREAVETLKELLASKYPEAQIAALDRVKTLGAEFARNEKFDEEVKSFVLRAGADGKTAAAALRALADFPHLAGDAQIEQRIASALKSADAELLRAATQVTLLSPSLRDLPVIKAALDELLKTQSASKRRMILDLINADAPVNDDLRIINLLADSLEDREENVRSAAVNALRRVKSLQSNAAIRAGLAKLTRDPNQRLQGLAIAMYQGQDGGVLLDLRAEEALDYNFFVQRVMPLLQRVGADGNGCVNCHTTHTIFKLIEPDKLGRFTDDQMRENYRSALKVVDMANPENSLIIRKPTGDASQEGLIGSKKTPHGGGMRWNGLNDPAAQTVLEWINGAKSAAPQ